MCGGRRARDVREDLRESESPMATYGEWTLPIAWSIRDRERGRVKKERLDASTSIEQYRDCFAVDVDVVL